MKLRLTTLLVCLFSSELFAQPINVIEKAVIEQPSQMMNDWLTKQTDESFANWQKTYATLKTDETIAAYQKRLRDKFVESIGGFPERTPLNAVVTGTIQREGYRVEKVLFESQPKHYVTGICFVPESDKFKGPYPGILVVCGHSDTGKGLEVYQAGAALAALNGMVAFLVDPVCQGERYEHVHDDGNIYVKSTTDGHTLLGSGAILLGQNTARNEIWDGMRAIDYLQQRPDVDGSKIGVMGNSGGGTQTSYIMALDDRVGAGAPSCYITSFERLLAERGPQDAEQNIFGQLAWGMDHVDYALMRAPVPVLFCTATHDAFPIDGSWTTYRAAKRLYTRQGYSERVDLVEADANHGWSPFLRQGSVQWMSRWLAGRDVPVREPKIKALSPKEYLVTEQGQVVLIPGAKSAFDLNKEEFERLAPARKALWSEPKQAIAKVREIAGIQPLASLPKPEAKKLGESKDGDITIERWVLTPEDGIVLPGLLYRPAKVSKGPLLYCHPEGKQASFKTEQGEHSALEYAKQGHLVFAVDLRGTGETFPEKAVWYNKRFGPDGKHLAVAYLLGKNYIGTWAEDVLKSARWLLENESLPLDQHKLTIVTGGRIGAAGLHAAAVESQLIDKITLIQSLGAMELIVSSPLSDDQFVNCIHGALRAYDLPDLARYLGNRIQVIEPTDSLNQPIKTANVR